MTPDEARHHLLALASERGGSVSAAYATSPSLLLAAAQLVQDGLWVRITSDGPPRYRLTDAGRDEARAVAR